jgi:hypothetical protein
VREVWATVSEAGRDPQAIAALLLGDPPMIAACAEHDVQTIIRLMRSRGASVRGLASVTATSAGRIYEWEVGTRQAAGFDIFERISDGFRIPGRYLRLADRPWESQATLTMQPVGDDLEPWVPSRTVEAIGRFTRMDLVLDRRDATKAIATLAVGTPLFERVERWLTSAHDRPDHGPLGNIGLDDVRRFEQAAQLFRDWDDHFGGGLRRKAVVGQLNEVADLLRDSHPDEITRRLFRVMAHLAETAAMMCWDSGRAAVAQRYYILALRASKEAREFGFGANIVASMARQLLYMGRPDDALELVRLAQDGAKDRAVSATVWAMLHTREAWAHAKRAVAGGLVHGAFDAGAAGIVSLEPDRGFRGAGGGLGFGQVAGQHGELPSFLAAGGAHAAGLRSRSPQPLSGTEGRARISHRG